MLYSNLCSQKITGSLSRIACINRPLASYGEDGQTTFRPGMCVHSEVSICECWAAARRPAPYMVRITSGVTALPPNM
ncbi:hypothetical protein D3C71_1456300 [compost metagenome]